MVFPLLLKSVKYNILDDSYYLHENSMCPITYFPRLSTPKQYTEEHPTYDGVIIFRVTVPLIWEAMVSIMASL